MDSGTKGIKSLTTNKKVTFQSKIKAVYSPESDTNGSFISVSDSDDLDTCSEGSTVYVHTPRGASELNMPVYLHRA